jgi:hypothetical protein
MYIRLGGGSREGLTRCTKAVDGRIKSGHDGMLFVQFVMTGLDPVIHA